MALDKLMLHAIAGCSSALWGRARGAKLVNPSVEWFAEVRSLLGPKALLVVRWTEPDQPLDNPKARAQQWVAKRQGDLLRMKGIPGPWATESYNEVPDQLAALYCEFELERLRILRSLGIRSVVGNWSVGTPDFPVWATYRPLLAALEPGDWVGVHEYWSSRDDLRNPYHVARFQLVPELRGRPLLVTEAGRDVVEGQGATGWKRTCGPAEYLEDLRQYNAILEQFPNVYGAMVFTVGGYWPAFDVTEIWPSITAQHSNPQSFPGVTVPVLPPPPTTPTFGWSERNGAPITHIIYHGAEGHNVKAYFGTYDARVTRKVSAHYAIERSGRVDTIVPEDRAAWHCGGSIIPGWTGDPNEPTIGIEMACDPPPALPGWTEAQIQSAIALGKDITKRRPIPRVCVKRHSDVDARHRDPRDFPWQRVLDGIYGPVEPPTTPSPAEKPLHQRAIDLRWLSEEATRALKAQEYDRCLALLLEQTAIAYTVERDTSA